MDIRFLGHACFELTDGDTRVLVDPFLTGNPKAAAEASELEPTHIFLTHGHADHYGDVIEIAKRTGAQVVANTELAGELGEQGGLENVADPNIGGTVEFEGGWVRLTPAWHTATSPNGTVHTPAGLVINLGGKTVYHVGDTGLFSDIRLAGERDQLDAALVCIGGHYTMDRHDAAIACEWIGAPTVIPCHYDTFPPIETDAQAFKADVEQRTGRQDDGRGARPGRDAQPLEVVLRAAREPDRTVLPVVRDEGGAERREEDAGGPVVDPLTADPDAATIEVVTEETITVCPWRLHCVSPHFP